MDADWDLHAVVRGCAAVNTTPIPTSAATDNEFSIPPSLPFHNNENSFDDFPGLFNDDKNDPFLGLHEIYQVFCFDPPPAPTISAASTPVAQVFQPQNAQIPQIQPLLQMNMPRQESVQLRNTSFPSPLSFPATNSQPFRQRRRKNQQTKMIREMTQEQLAADSWAWRKYGQKPIKGSPHPRNYYRCSTSKGCAARKQVERSLNDSEIFVVSYTGEHTHPRPIYRSSLTGSTRNRFGPTNGFGPTHGHNKINITTITNNYNNTLSLPMGGSHSPPGSGSSFSPDTPTTEGKATKQNDDVEMAGNVGDDDDDENVMMVNDLMMNDDEGIFKIAFKDSDESSGGDMFSNGMLMSPPWTPTNYFAAATMFDGEGVD